MAKIFECDRCGHQERFTDGIVGNEFAYYGPRHRLSKHHSRREIMTLAHNYRFEKWVDVCKPCYSEIVSAVSSAKQEEKQSIMARAKNSLGLT